MLVNPLTIEIALHYVCTTTEFPRADTPAAQEAILNLIDKGMLERGDFQVGDNCRCYAPTYGLRKWLEKLCNVPFPKQVWAFPDETRE